MNEKVKKALIGIGAFFTGVIAGVAAILLRNRGTVADVRERIDDAEGAIGRASGAITDAQSTTGNISEGIGELEASVDRSANVLEEIRSQRLD